MPELKIRRKSVSDKFCSSLTTCDESAENSSPVKEQTEEVFGLEILARCTSEAEEKLVRSTQEKSARFTSSPRCRRTKSLDDLHNFRKCLMCVKSMKAAKFEAHLRSQHNVAIKYDKHFLDSNQNSGNNSTRSRYSKNIRYLANIRGRIVVRYLTRPQVEYLYFG